MSVATKVRKVWGCNVHDLIPSGILNGTDWKVTNIKSITDYELICESETNTDFAFNQKKMKENIEPFIKKNGGGVQRV